MNTPEFDEDGYPTEETLEKIKKWEYSDGWLELMQFVGKAWHWPEYCTATDALNYWDKPVLRYRLVTGGWSGNESIITALEGNFIFWNMCWQESHRGGKHIFEIKKSEAE